MKKNAWLEFQFRIKCKDCWWDDEQTAQGLTNQGVWHYCCMKHVSIKDQADCPKRQYEKQYGVIR